MIGSFGTKCLTNLRIWMLLFAFLQVIRFSITIYILIKIESFHASETMQDFRRQEKQIESINLQIYYFLNPIFVLVWIYGQLAYFLVSLDEENVCKALSKDYVIIKNVTLIIQSISFIFASYSLVTWCSVVMMKVSGEDPIAHDSDE